MKLHSDLKHRRFKMSSSIFQKMPDGMSPSEIFEKAGSILETDKRTVQFRTNQTKTDSIESKKITDDEKMYIILICPFETDERYNSEDMTYPCSLYPMAEVNVHGEFIITNGRLSTFKKIIELLDDNDEHSPDLFNIDVERSKVIADGVPCSQAINIVQFMEHCCKLYNISKDDFNIRSYIWSEDDDEESYDTPATGNGYNTSFTNE